MTQVIAWLFLITILMSIWALVYLAVKIGRMLRELRLLIQGAGLTLQVTKNRLSDVASASDKIEQTAAGIQQTAVGMQQTAADMKKTGESHY